MKKLLTVSVLAIMAVSAANADIASTGITGLADFTGTTYIKSDGDLTVAAKTLDTKVKANADAIDTVEGRMGTAEGKITTLEGTVGGHTTDIESLETAVENIKAGTGVNKATKEAAGIVQVGSNINVVDGVISVDKATTTTEGIVALTDAADPNDSTKAVTGKAVHSAIAATNNAVFMKQEKSSENYQMGNESGGWTTMSPDQIAALNSGVTSSTVSQVATNKAAVEANTDAIAGMDLQKTGGGTGQYISSVTQADGNVTATVGTLTAVAQMDVPTACDNGAVTCALVYDKSTKGLKWEAIMQ